MSQPQSTAGESVTVTAAAGVVALVTAGVTVVAGALAGVAVTVTAGGKNE